MMILCGDPVSRGLQFLRAITIMSSLRSYIIISLCLVEGGRIVSYRVLFTTFFSL